VGQVKLKMRVYADPAAVGNVRSHVRSWPDALGWPIDKLDDLLVPVNEAETAVFGNQPPRPALCARDSDRG
jgi:hypothetical protein